MLKGLVPKLSLGTSLPAKLSLASWRRSQVQLGNEEDLTAKKSHSCGIGCTGGIGGAI
jgi:hypothetical protein